VEDDGSFYIDFEALKSSDRSAASLINAASDGVLTWEELSPFFQKTYYARRNAPVSLALLKSESDFPAGDSLFVLSVTGVMTTTTRNVAIARSSIRNALMSYRASGDRLLYPKGTVIIASHSLDDTDLEFTAMRKREDDFWDYFVYDADGLLTDSTQTDPKHLNAPTQCVGCHLGTRLFEPERSFPAAARPGPDGPRGVHVDPVLRIGSAVRYLDEHRKRSDGILGLYGTIFVSELLVSRREGTLSDVDAALLDTLGL